MPYYYIRTRLIILTFLLISIYFTCKLVTSHDENGGKGGWGFHAMRRNLLPPPLPNSVDLTTDMLNDTMKSLLNINDNCSSQHFYDIPEWTLQIFNNEQGADGDEEIEEECDNKRSVLFQSKYLSSFYYFPYLLFDGS